MPNMKAVPCSIFDHVLWGVREGDGSWHSARIPPGACVLLFTSLDALNDYIECCGEGTLRPAVFSRGRKEFGQRAREAARAGIAGALFDVSPSSPEAPFLQFARAPKAPPSDS